MKTKIFALVGIVALMSSLLLIASTGPVSIEARSVESLTMFQATKFDGHYRVPNTAEIERLLHEEGILLDNASPSQVEIAVQTFMEEWLKHNPTTPNPGKLRKLLAAERGKGPKVRAESPIKVLAVPVEFPGTDTFEHCGDMVTTVGPLHNEIAPPGPRDNNTVWYEDTTPELYEKLYFGIGPDAGVIVNHPNLGPVDLRGNTMANYYLEQSEGTFMPARYDLPELVASSAFRGLVWRR